MHLCLIPILLYSVWVGNLDIVANSSPVTLLLTLKATLPSLKFIAMSHNKYLSNESLNGYQLRGITDNFEWDVTKSKRF